VGASFVAILASSKTEVRGESPSYCRSGFSRDLCVIEDGGLGLKSYLNRSCDEAGGLRPSPIIRRHEPNWKALLPLPGRLSGDRV
jgi:hypothetical protein